MKKLRVERLESRDLLAVLDWNGFVELGRLPGITGTPPYGVTQEQWQRANELPETGTFSIRDFCEEHADDPEWSHVADFWQSQTSTPDWQQPMLDDPDLVWFHIDEVPFAEIKEALLGHRSLYVQRAVWGKLWHAACTQAA